jgi:hypothetical protein
MSTKIQALANRLNSLRSTGPKTNEGKSAMRHNAVKHGILASEPVLSDESRDEFLLFRQQFWDYFKPVGPVEEEEIRKLVNYGWQLRRCASIDTGTFENLQRDQKFGMNTLALAFASGAVTFGNLTRYEGHFSRQYRTTLHELERLQAVRAGQPNLPPAAADIAIELTVQEQVRDALEDFQKDLDASDRLKREGLRQLRPKDKKTTGGDSHGK